MVLRGVQDVTKTNKQRRGSLCTKRRKERFCQTGLYSPMSAKGSCGQQIDLQAFWWCTLTLFAVSLQSSNVSNRIQQYLTMKKDFGIRACHGSDALAATCNAGQRFLVAGGAGLNQNAVGRPDGLESKDVPSVPCSVRRFLG